MSVRTVDGDRDESRRKRKVKGGKRGEEREVKRGRWREVNRGEALAKEKSWSTATIAWSDQEMLLPAARCPLSAAFARCPLPQSAWPLGSWHVKSTHVCWPLKWLRIGNSNNAAGYWRSTAGRGQGCGKVAQGAAEGQRLWQQQWHLTVMTTCCRCRCRWLWLLDQLCRPVPKCQCRLPQHPPCAAAASLSGFMCCLSTPYSCSTPATYPAPPRGTGFSDLELGRARLTMRLAAKLGDLNLANLGMRRNSSIWWPPNVLLLLLLLLWPVSWHANVRADYLL